MKKKLLSFVAFALIALMTQAQSWTKPSLKLTTDVVPEKAYIYNVEQGKFLTKGGAWGTHAAITPVVSNAFLYEIQDQGDGAYVLYCAKAANTGRLGRSTETEVYTDFKSGDWATTWSFYKNEETGYYRIRTAANDTHYGADKFTDDDPVNYGLYELAWNENGEDLTNGNGEPMGTNEGCYMQDPKDDEGWSFDWAFMTEDDYAVYNALTSLYNKLTEALEEGYSEAELAEQAALLSSTDVEAINAAVAAVTQMILDYGYNHATPENPFDVTDAITNPTFEGARDSEPTGWIDEYSNMKIQNNKAYHIWDDEADVESTEYGFQNFSQNWTASADASCGASNIYQVLNDLPQGTYILQADAIATSASASLEVNGAELYALSGAARYATPIDKNVYGAGGSGLPHRYQLFLTHMGGDLTIGYGLSAEGYAKWFGVDNIKLFYAGPVDNPGLVALASALEAAQPYVDYYAEESKYYYSEESKDELEKELKADEGLTDSEECLAAAGTINGLLKNIKAEVKSYSDLKKLIDRVNADMSKYESISALGDMHDEYKGAYEDKTATIAQIDEWIAAYDGFLVAAIKEAMKDASEENPVEITALFENLGFEENTAESKTPKNWTSNSGQFKARVNTAEVWNESFNAYTTLSDLPAGAYRITSHVLSRSGSSVENYNSEGTGVSAEFYANNSSVKVKSQHLGAGVEKLYSDDVNLTGDETNPLWAPNSMEGARVYFNVEDTPYFSEVTANLIKDGDPLVIGFRDLGGEDGTVEGNSWTIWSDVRVYYIGVSSNALYEEMCGLAQTALEYAENCQVTEGISKLEDAASAAEDVPVTASDEEITTAINSLNDAISYYNDGKGLVTKVYGAQSEYEGVMNEYEVDGETELEKILDEMSDAISDEVFPSNEKMQEWIDALPAARTAFVYAAVVKDDTPSEENPIDISDVMSNPKFDTHTSAGWVATKEGEGHIGGGQAEASGALETWNTTSFDIHQTISGLPAGFYRLSCQAIFRNGNNGDDTALAYYTDPVANNPMKFYVNNDSVSVTSIYAGVGTESLFVDGTEVAGQQTFVYEGTTYYTPNTMVSFKGYADALGCYDNVIIAEVKEGESLTVGLCFKNAAKYAWAPFDDFKIEAMGTTKPTAVENVSVAGDAPKAIYDLIGRRVAKAVKGIYIINGKKVVK